MLTYLAWMGLAILFCVTVAICAVILYIAVEIAKLTRPRRRPLRYSSYNRYSHGSNEPKMETVPSEEPRFEKDEKGRYVD